MMEWRDAIGKSLSWIEDNTTEEFFCLTWPIMQRIRRFTFQDFFV